MKKDISIALCIAILAGLSHAGCNENKTESSPITTMRTASFDGAQSNCTNGGVKVEVLVDGTVDDAQTQYICNGANGQDGQDGPLHNALVATSNEVGDNCANGGIRVDFGLDGNDNSLLDTAEILGSRYICNGENGDDGNNGENGTNASIQTTPFADAQGGCTNGGIIIEVLVDGMVKNDQTQYICNGAKGENGSNGTNASILTTAFDDAQGNCTYGGIKVEVLVDGVVKDDQTKYICNGAKGENGSNGPNASILTTAFDDAQGNCTNGGVKVEILVNGVVKDNQTKYICNGINGLKGENGTNGTNASILTSKFDGALHGCTNGGIKVEVLVDGVVQNSQTQYLCNGAQIALSCAIGFYQNGQNCLPDDDLHCRGVDCTATPYWGDGICTRSGVCQATACTGDSHLYDNGTSITCEANTPEHCGSHTTACVEGSKCVNGTCTGGVLRNCNGIFDPSDFCDGGNFMDGKTTCHEWDNRFIAGDVKCTDDCEIDYSDCIECMTGQEYSETYHACVYPIVTADDLSNLAKNWDKTGEDAYPTKDGSAPAFLLKDNISINTKWTLAIGSSIHAFNGSFYGNDKTIVFNDADGTNTGLFGTTSYATVKDLEVTFNNTHKPDVYILLAQNVDHGAFTNIKVGGKVAFKHDSGPLSLIFNKVSFATIDNFTSTLVIDLELWNKTNTFSLFASELNNVTANKITMKGEFERVYHWLYYNSYTQPVATFVSLFSNSTLTNSNLATSIRKIEVATYDNSHVIYQFVIRIINGNSLIDSTKFNGAFQTYKSSRLHTDTNIIMTTRGENVVLSNIEDNSAFFVLNGDTPSTENYFTYESNDLKLVNAVINGEYAQPNHNNNMLMANVVFTKMDSYIGTDTENPSTPQTYSLYFKSDWNSGTANSNVMNNNLENKAEGIPSGNYLPWIPNAAKLKFDAAESDLYVIP